AEPRKRRDSRNGRNVEPAQCDHVEVAGIDDDACRGIQSSPDHADAAVDAGRADDLDRLVDDHRTVARGVEDHDLSAGVGLPDRDVEASAWRGKRARWWAH